MKNKGVKDITIDDIVSVARELRDEENSQLQVPQRSNMQVKIFPSLTGKGKGVGLWLAAASLIGFLFGFGLRPEVNNMLSPATPLTAHRPSSTIHGDTIVLREVVHDTVFQTRVIIRNVAPQPVVAQADNTTITPEDAPRQQADELEGTALAVGCSMLCDDIPYAILARN